MEILSKNTSQTKELARRIADQAKPGDIVLLSGDLGSGKTAFTRYLTSALGFSDRVQSPTFILMRRYENLLDSSSPIKHVNHFDLYRLNDASELEDLSLDEIFNEEDSLTIVEWPELVEKQIKRKTIKIEFQYIDEFSRKIIVKGI